MTSETPTCTVCAAAAPGLACHLCAAPIHMACVALLRGWTHQPMRGDVYYQYTCAGCGQGTESLRRPLMKWPEVVHTALYSLSLDQDSTDEVASGAGTTAVAPAEPFATIAAVAPIADVAPVAPIVSETAAPVEPLVAQPIVSEITPAVAQPETIQTMTPMDSTAPTELSLEQIAAQILTTAPAPKPHWRKSITHQPSECFNGHMYYRHQTILDRVEANVASFWGTERCITLANIATTLSMGGRDRFVTKGSRTGMWGLKKYQSLSDYLKATKSEYEGPYLDISAEGIIEAAGPRRNFPKTKKSKYVLEEVSSFSGGSEGGELGNQETTEGGRPVRLARIKGEDERVKRQCIFKINVALSMQDAETDFSGGSEHEEQPEEEDDEGQRKKSTKKRARKSLPAVLPMFTAPQNIAPYQYNTMNPTTGPFTYNPSMHMPQQQQYSPYNNQYQQQYQPQQYQPQQYAPYVEPYQASAPVAPVAGSKEEQAKLDAMLQGIAQGY